MRLRQLDHDAGALPEPYAGRRTEEQPLSRRSRRQTSAPASDILLDFLLLPPLSEGEPFPPVSNHRSSCSYALSRTPFVWLKTPRAGPSCWDLPTPRLKPAHCTGSLLFSPDEWSTSLTENLPMVCPSLSAPRPPAWTQQFLQEASDRVISREISILPKGLLARLSHFSPALRNSCQSQEHTQRCTGARVAVAGRGLERSR